MPNLSSCSRCGCSIIIHQTTIDRFGEITHEGNEWTQLPDLCQKCEKEIAKELARLRKDVKKRDRAKQG